MNEYKDWEKETIEEQKHVIEKYPFLRARDIDALIWLTEVADKLEGKE